MSEGGSRPGSSLGGIENVMGRKGGVETGSLRKETERTREIEQTKVEINEAKDVKNNKDVNGEESPERTITSRRQRSESSGKTSCPR